MPAQIEKLLFLCRYLLAPMALGLSIGIILVFYKFFEQIIEIINELLVNHTIADAEFLIDVLSLVDFFLIAGLLIMVMIAGYGNFVVRTQMGESSEMPSWIGHLSHHDLKLNLSLTIVAISMFLLLQAFLTMVDVEEGTTRDLTKTFEVLPWLIGIHITFVFSALILAIINRLSDDKPKPNVS